ncbi:MAG: alpha/beta fold hydrolase [Polaromonas sp.]|nr:alpha/beta fold hydrolase [Polaromonas sp.]
MTNSPEPPDEVRQLLARATGLETPCGSGSMVWHRWEPEQSDPRHLPLVLLHGGSGSWTHWLRNIDALLDAGRSVLAADLPGFGDSASPPSGMDADALPEPVEAGLRVLLGDGACDIVAFSFSGMVAGLIAARWPSRVAQLVLVGSPGLGVASRSTVTLTAWRHLPDPAAREAVHRSNLAALMLYQPEAITALALRLHSDNTLRDRMKGRRLAYTDILARTLKEVRCPVTAIYGRKDALYRERQEALAEALKAAPDFRGMHWIDNAGHWVQFEQSAAFDAVLRAVLEEGSRLPLLSKQ